MKTCETCRAWKKSPLPSSQGAGICEKIVNYQYCPQDWKAYCDAQDMCDGRLVTMGDFGCTLHEPKTQGE